MRWWSLAFGASAVAGSVAVLCRRGRPHDDQRVSGAGIAAPVRQTRQEALDLRDDVVQGLAMAKLSLELGETAAGIAALERTLAAAQELVIDLVDAERHDGTDRRDLRRVGPAELH